MGKPIIHLYDEDKEKYVAIPAIKGDKGDDGTTPHIGDNGDWYLGETDTGVKATGSDASVTSANIANALGYTPRKAWYVTITGTLDAPSGDKTPAEIYQAYTDGYAVYAVVQMTDLYSGVPFALPLVAILPVSGSYLACFSTLAEPHFNGATGIVEITATWNQRWYLFTSAIASEEDIPTVPTALKNPNALTIKVGDTTMIYDGSSAQAVDVKPATLDPLWLREQIADMADDYVEFAPLNAGVSGYVAAAQAAYTADDQTVSIVADYTSQGTDDPEGLEVSAGASASLEIISVASKVGWTQPSGDKLYNLIPKKVYKWTGASGGSGKAKSTDALRMIRMTGARNVRDLGGWPCDGGIVQYGKIFRGGQLSQNNVAVATAWDIAELNALGVKVELDIRATSEQDRTTSILGDDVEFVSKPTANNAVGLLKNHPDEAVAILNAIFDAVAADKPIYFHCQAGADRTGTIAFVLLALLGVGHVDLDIDYELTSFYSSRKRNASPWPEQWAYINSFSGNSPKEKVTAWALANGIASAQIDAFRKKMIYTGFIVE